jgi:uncharacterized membrane protein SpoIIM required for sporulation
LAESLPHFVARRKPDWDSLEGLLARLAKKSVHLAEVSAIDRLYRRASGDLAHAQTFFPGTDVHRSLNQLCVGAYRAIYSPRPDRVASLKQFFGKDFPQAVQQHLSLVGVAAALMGLGVVLGATTVALSPDGVQLLVPDNLMHFIERKELWTDRALDATAPSEMAARIFTNNLRVTISAFALGLTAGLGTVAVLFFNGLQLGAVVAACAQHDLLGGILSFISAHGPVELSIISISGGAGLLLAQALLAPGERPRSEVLREHSRDAVRLVLGCAPFLVAIGIVEGFVSPGTFFPWWVKAPLGVALGLGFWGYLLKGAPRSPRAEPQA